MISKIAPPHRFCVRLVPDIEVPGLQCSGMLNIFFLNMRICSLSNTLAQDVCAKLTSITPGNITSISISRLWKFYNIKIFGGRLPHVRARAHTSRPMTVELRVAHCAEVAADRSTSSHNHLSLRGVNTIAPEGVDLNASRLGLYTLLLVIVIIVVNR